MKKAFAVKQILSAPAVLNGSGVIDVAPGYFSRATVKRAVHVYDTTGVVLAADLVNSEILNTTALGSIVLTLPSAASILTAFEDAGVILQEGDSFAVLVTGDCLLIPSSITIAPSGSVTVLSGGTVVIVHSKSALVTFFVTSVASGAATMAYSAEISNT
jgi:hypothetical protein